MPLQKSYGNMLLLMLVLAVSCVNDSDEKQNNNLNNTPAAPIRQIDYSLMNSLPHDTTAFTEGLLWYNGKLYESTGSPDNMPQTKSYFGIINLANGIVEDKQELDKTIFFGEGIAILHDRLFQLTYKNRKAFVYDLPSMKKIDEFSFDNKEGWGLTTDGENLVMSDGTDVLTYIDPVTYKVVKRLNVTENGNAIDNLNELEYIEGSIFANIYYSNNIVRINPETGMVTGKMDLWNIYKLAKDERPAILQMNGIAYDTASKKMYVTGKMWPKIFEIKLN